jgi:uroporphyrinogen III methyltransferase / synthase
VKVIVTRPPGQARELVTRLQALGHDVVECPLIAIEPIAQPPLDTTSYDWVIVTSPNGADLFARLQTGELRAVAAIGPGTAEMLRARGIEPLLVPRVSTQEGLLAELPRPPGRVLFAGAEGARRLLVDELEADFRPLYRTVERRSRSVPEGDLVVLASASAARAYAAAGGRAPAVSIGPQTTRAAESAGVKILAEAETNDLEGLIGAVQVCSSRS